ncbi:helicase [beta proteobacterium AAP121]|nr:helicase [beta proteobacterium AAP65]KPF94864.1 helicase [beta proteobacterium AAP121]
MRLIKNVGGDRVLDHLRPQLPADARVDLATDGLSLFAFDELAPLLTAAGPTRLLLSSPVPKPRPRVSGLDSPPAVDPDPLANGLLGDDLDRERRNGLRARGLAADLLQWLETAVDVRAVPGKLPQSAWITGNSHALAPVIDERPAGVAITGDCSATTRGLGLSPGNQFSLIQCSETEAERQMFAQWFDATWRAVGDDAGAKQKLLDQVRRLAEQEAPSAIYFGILYNLFKDLGDELDEERIVKSATGIRNTQVWKKLYKFQRDGVVGAIDKLERLGGCILADSVGLGKTFEALAVIKYYELRNDRVLVLAPKRLRDNWTLYKANDRRNSLAADRLNYDVLNHTDLSRDGGSSGDIDLAHVNWGNYDLVVIDESHNFRNKQNHRDRDSRYKRLMRQVIQSGVKTKVLMLSATPVNNRLADLKNQIAFVTEGRDDALAGHGLPSVETTVRLAQGQFNRWQQLDEADRRPSRLMDMLGFDYFRLLDLLTIARSRKHIEKYYGTAETGTFPKRLRPINVKADVDSAGLFPPIVDINTDIRRLNLSAYAPLRYVLPAKQAEYDAKYSVAIRGGESIFRQVDREESLIHLMRVNLLKRMESSVHAFALTVERQLADVNGLLAKLENHADSIEELSIEDVEVDNPAFESLLVGRKVKVLLQDVDRIRWRQDLTEDRNRLATLLSNARAVDRARDAKLDALRTLIKDKIATPINVIDGKPNRKLIVFTAFADTALYLYDAIAAWALAELGLHAAIVTGTGSNKTNLPGLRTDLASVLTAFAPRAKERPAEFASEGELDLLIATDCISEGQNLQDGDYLVNYDIHWNPVRIIQRFGRIDRIGSPNAHIQLVNFWPNMALDEYIGLEQRVSGRMVLLDISATGEENLIERDAGNLMNDLEYRRKQLQKLQEAVIDLEDLSSGISIADLTLADYRIELAGFLREHPGKLAAMPLGAYAVTSSAQADDALPPGAIFCLRAEGEAALATIEPGYPLAPHYVVHVGADAAVLLPHSQAKQVLDRLKGLCLGRDMPDAQACARFDKLTKAGRQMQPYQTMLQQAIASIVGKSQERAVASLFTPGGTHARKGEFAGMADFEVVAFLVIA